MPDLLIELFSEEIPARMQARAADDLKRLVTGGLVEAGLTYASAGAFATPRRLALSVHDLTGASPTTREERKGPRTDAPQAAIEGFLRSTGLTLDRLERRAEKKGEAFYAVVERPGRPAAGIVAEVLEATIRDFPWPKSMRWGAGSLRWVRPLHSILCLLVTEAGAEVVPLVMNDIAAGDTTRGHRFMAPEPFRVTSFEDYAAKLRRAKVMLDPAERREAIRHGAGNLAFARGWEIVADEGLLAEVAGLVEWPVPLMGTIEARFLDLPPEVLRTSMKEHQKFFSARNPGTGRIEGFVTVANIEADDGGEAILAGNQRVLAARLSDAAFFWENDLRGARAGMAAWEAAQAQVTFHAKLGSEADRTRRIAALAREIAPAVGADPEQAERAAKLAKLDLRSGMVGEFPELQGVMGRYYLLAAGEPEAVADVARDHYAPRGPEEPVPTAPVSVAVALADKLDTLTGFWAIDEKPTGSKDPFALRRAALGVIRLVLGNGVRLGMPVLERALLGVLHSPEMLRHQIHLPAGAASDERDHWQATWWFDPEDHDASENDEPRRLSIPFAEFEAAARGNRLANVGEIFDNLDDPSDQSVTRDDRFSRLPSDLLGFLHDRLKVHLREQGVRHDVIDAVLALPGNDDLVAVVARATALSDMLKTPDGENLLLGLKRAANLLAQAEARDGVEYSFGPDPKLAESDEERAIFAALDRAEPEIRRATEVEDFPAAMTAIAGLRAPIDAFFDAVQINTDNAVIRRNRLNLLHRIRAAGARIADFSRVEG